MKLGNFIKSPAERKRYEIDYYDWLDTNETLATVTFAVTPVETSGLTINGNSIPTPSTSVIFYANAGVAGNNYTVDIKATTSSGQIKEDTILFSVRSA